MVNYLTTKAMETAIAGGVYNAQGKDLCTMQKLCKNDSKLNLDRSFIIILMLMVKIWREKGMGDPLNVSAWTVHAVPPLE